jgi:hypothetical protein
MGGGTETIDVHVSEAPGLRRVEALRTAAHHLESLGPSDSEGRAVSPL